MKEAVLEGGGTAERGFFPALGRWSRTIRGG